MAIKDKRKQSVVDNKYTSVSRIEGFGLELSLAAARVSAHLPRSLASGPPESARSLVVFLGFARSDGLVRDNDNAALCKRDARHNSHNCRFCSCVSLGLGTSVYRSVSISKIARACNQHWYTRLCFGIRHRCAVRVDDRHGSELEIRCDTKIWLTPR